MGIIPWKGSPKLQPCIRNQHQSLLKTHICVGFIGVHPPAGFRVFFPGLWHYSADFHHIQCLSFCSSVKIHRLLSAYGKRKFWMERVRQSTDGWDMCMSLQTILSFSKAESAQGDLNSQSGTSPCVRHLHLPFREQKIELVFLETEGDDADATLFVLLPSGYSTHLGNRK